MSLSLSRSLTRACFAVVLLGVAALAARAQEGPVGDKAQLSVFADTTKITIPGLEGIQLPPQAQAVLGGASGQRMLRVSLWTPGTAPDSATASLDIPAGLKLGQTLPLEILKIPTGTGNAPTELKDFELLRYWGCGAEVGAGQPRTLKAGDLSPELKDRLSRLRSRGASTSALPNWTDATWPNALERRPPQVAADAVLDGKYQLKSSYAGGTEFEVPATVRFLEPVAVTAARNPDLSQAVAFSWKPIPGVLGYGAMATGMKGQNRVVLWTNTEREADAVGARLGSAEGVRELVTQGALMPPTHTECILPTGIFKGCEGVMLQVIAYGPSFAQSGSPSVRVTSRSVGMLMLGQPGGFGGFGGRKR